MRSEVGNQLVIPFEVRCTFPIVVSPRKPIINQHPVTIFILPLNTVDRKRVLNHSCKTTSIVL